MGTLCPTRKYAKTSIRTKQEFSFKKRLDNKLGFYSELWLATIKIPNYKTRRAADPQKAVFIPVFDLKGLQAAS